MEVLGEGEAKAKGPAKARARRDGRTETPRYVYGILRTPEQALDLGPIGLSEAPVELIAVAEVAAVVSDFRGACPIPVLRRNLEPHHRVLSAVMSRQTILPLTFGHVVLGDRAVRQFLRESLPRFRSVLKELDGCLEMSLRVSLQGESPFAHVVKRYPELAELRDRVFRVAPGEAPSREEMISLGREFAACLEREREAQIERMLGQLRGKVRQSAVRPPGRESVVADLALLVPRPDRLALEDRVMAVADTYGPEFLFELRGPYPPHSFVQLDMEG